MKTLLTIFSLVFFINNFILAQEGNKMSLRIENDFESTKNPNLGYPTPEVLLTIREQLSSGGFDAQRSIQGLTWQERGPNDVGGRVRALIYDPNDLNHKKVWAGSVSGGLWFNNDIANSTSSWIKVNDFWDGIAITTIAYNPLNTMEFYVGTGEGWYNADAVVGCGIWKTTDGGVTWSLLASTAFATNFRYIQKIVVHPVTGDIYVATRDNGIMRSQDGGNTWSVVLGAGNGASQNRVADIEIASDNTIYATLGIFTTDGIYSSINGDIGTWAKLNTGTNGFPTTGFQRIEIGTAPSNANVLYALAQSTASRGILEIYKTIDKGLTWTICSRPIDPDLTPTNDFARGQAWYDLAVGVDQFNENNVFVGGINLFKSSDGGTNWTKATPSTQPQALQVHTDHHAIVFKPGSSDELLDANDGGVTYTSTASASFPTFSRRVKDFNITQIYKCAIHPSTGVNNFLMGMQDNGSYRLTSSGIGAAGNKVYVGDGYFCAFDNDDPNLQIVSAALAPNTLYAVRTTGSFSTIPGSNAVGQNFNPADYDPINNLLYAGSFPDELKVYSNLYQGTPTVATTTAFNVPMGGSVPRIIKVSPFNPSTLFLGGVSGDKIFKVNNVNTPNQIVSTINMPVGPLGRKFSCIEFGADEQHFLVTYSNYGVVSLWITDDGGVTWVNKEDNLPDMPIWWALYNPNDRREVLLATELGTWSTDDITLANPDWGVSNTGMGNVRVAHMATRSSDNLVIAGTYGRGLFSTNVFNHPVANFDYSGCFTTDFSISFVDQSILSPTSWLWDFGDGSTSTVQNPNHIFSASGTYTVTLTATNSSGSGSIVKIINVGTYDYYSTRINPLIISNTSTQLTDQNGDGLLMIKGPVYIDIIAANKNYNLSGKTWFFGNDFTIDPTRDLGIPPSGVIVMPGNTLTMDNTVFTSASGCEMWHGVQVWGKAAAKKVPAAYGKLVMKNQSVISNAHIGVSCYRSTPQTRDQTEYGYGILQAYGNSKFINNNVSVAFRGWTLIVNSSYVNSCQFLCNAPLIDPVYNGEGSSVFIDLNSVKQPAFRANSFENTYTAFAVDKRGTAISSYNAAYNVVKLGSVGNTFTNLTQGISTNATGGIKNLNVTGNTFTNVQQAITTVGTNYDNITANTFTIPDETLIPTWGVYLNGTQGFNVSDANTFAKCATCASTGSKGVIVLDGSTFGGTVRGNNFTGLETASQSEGNNGDNTGGLQLKCNTYTDNTYAISVSPQYPGIGLLAPQGIGCDINDPRPANKFPDACTGSGNYIDINTTIAFTYVENGNNPVRATPACVKTGATYVTLNTCGGIPDDNCNPGGGCTTPECLQAQRNQMEHEQDVLQKKQLLHELIIGHLLSNSPNSKTAIIHILQAWNTDDSKKLLVPIFIDEGEFSNARSTLNQIPQNNQENINYHALYNVLIDLGEGGKPVDEMTMLQEQVIRDVANSSTLVKYHAQAVLEGANKEHFVRIPEEIQVSTARLGNMNELMENKISFIHDAGVPLLMNNYPNPFDESTIIPYYLPEKIMEAELLMTDITGRQIQKNILKSGANSVEFKTNGLENGIYYYTMIIENKIFSVKKMVILK